MEKLDGSLKEEGVAMIEDAIIDHLIKRDKKY